MYGVMFERQGFVGLMQRMARRLMTGAALSFTACSGGSDSAAPQPTTPVPPAPAKVASVEVAPASPSLTVGGTVQLAAVAKDAAGGTLSGRSVSWSSSSAAVASISASGLATAVAPGTASLTATVDGVSGSASLTVLPVPVASVVVAPTSATLLVGTSTTLTATARDGAGATLAGRAISWASSASTVASVSTTGVVTAVAAGAAVITATSEGKSATVSITVQPVPVATVLVTPATVALTVGGAQQLSAGARDSAGGVLTGRPVVWTSASTTIATISTVGVVTAVSPGTTTVTATVEGRSASATVTVSAIPVASVTVAPATATMVVDSTLPLVATLRDANGSTLSGRTISWASSATTVATVSSTGIVTAIAAGSATLTATSEGRTGSATVTVTAAPVATIALTPTAGSVFVDSTLQLEATLRDARSRVLMDRAVSWATSAPLIASVSATGRVTGVAPGSATITATSEGKTATVTISVSTRLTFRMYESTSLTGPWTARDVVVAGSDALQVVDPSPVLMPDGTIYLYYLMNYFRSGDPASAQPGNQWKMGVATSSDNGLSFTHRGTPVVSNVAITDPFPMVLADGRIRLLYAQTTGSTSYVYSATSSDALGLTTPYIADAGARSSGSSIPGSLRIGSTFYLYTCEAGIMWASSTDGLTFGPRSTAVSSSGGGIICDPSPISVASGSYAMAYKTRPPGIQNPRSDTTYIATSTNGTTWNQLSTPVGAGSVPGLVRDRNGVYRVYVVYFPPR